MILTLPKVSESQWQIISNTIVQSRKLKNKISITYYDGVKRTAIGKVIDVDNMDQQITVKDDEDYWVLHYKHIMEAAVIAS